MTAKGMYFALKYFYEIKKGDVSKSENGIGIIPHIYEDSRGLLAGAKNEIEVLLPLLKNRFVKLKVRISSKLR